MKCYLNLLFQFEELIIVYNDLSWFSSPNEVVWRMRGGGRVCVLWVTFKCLAQFFKVNFTRTYWDCGISYLSSFGYLIYSDLEFRGRGISWLNPRSNATIYLLNICCDNFYHHRQQNILILLFLQLQIYNF